MCLNWTRFASPFLSYIDIHRGAACGENGHVNYIKDLRVARGWSMQQLADACSPPTTAPTINKLEKSHVKLTQQWMHRLGDALGCHPLEILDGGPERLKPRERKLMDMFRSMSDERQDVVFTTTSVLAGRAPSHMIEVTDEDGNVLYLGPEQRVSGSDASYTGSERRYPAHVRRL